MPTFTPDELPYVVRVAQAHRSPSALDADAALSCRHDGAQGVATRRVSVDLPPLWEEKYAVLDVTVTLVCQTCWRATEEHFIAGDLPIHDEAGNHLSRAPLPSRAEAVELTVTDLLVGTDLSEDPSSVAALRAEVERVLERYDAEGLDTRPFWA